MNLWQRFSRRERILVMVTAVVIIAALLHTIVLEDIVARWDRLAFEIESKERLLQRNTNLIREADSIDSEFAKISKVLDDSPGESVTPSSVLKHIQILAKGEIELENIKPLDTKNLGTSVLFEFELEGNAEKEKLVRFLYKVATSDEALTIHALTLNSTREGKTLKYHMVISKMFLL